MTEAQLKERLNGYNPPPLTWSEDDITKAKRASLFDPQGRIKPEAIFLQAKGTTNSKSTLTVSAIGDTTPATSAKQAFELAYGNQPNYIALADVFLREQPVYYDKAGLWFIWNKTTLCWELIDETDLLNAFDMSGVGLGNTSVRFRGQVIDAVKRRARLNQPKPFPKNWLQFGAKIVDITTHEEIDPKPYYFGMNVIPYKLGNTSETPHINNLFDSWVGKEWTDTLYELIAYCTYRGYPIQLCFWLVGEGRNGKSTYLQLLAHYLGKNNVCTADLHELTKNQFATFPLWKKNACIMGESKYEVMRDSSLFKRLCGGDLIRFEAKGKQPFEDYSFATLIIGANSLPTSQDESDGFHRRNFVIEFPNRFEEKGKDILAEIPEIEFQNLSRKVVDILPKLLQTGTFTNQGNIEDRKAKYNSFSNPFEIFMNWGCDISDPDAFILFGDLHSTYALWLKEHKRRVVSKAELSHVLTEIGFAVNRTSKRIPVDFQSKRDIQGVVEVSDYVSKNGTFVDGLKLRKSASSVRCECVLCRTPNIGSQVESATHDALDAQKKSNSYINQNPKERILDFVKKQTSTTETQIIDFCLENNLDTFEARTILSELSTKRLLIQSPAGFFTLGVSL